MAFDPITAILNIGSTIIDRVIPDRTAAAAAKVQLIQAQLAGELASAHDQLNVDAVEAASQSVFVAGWRPFIGWVCGGSLVYSFILQPFAVAICVLAKVSFDASKLPHLDTVTLIGLLTSMLGMGVMRSYDKTQGNATLDAGLGNGH